MHAYICMDIGGSLIKTTWVSDTLEHGRINVYRTPKELKETQNTLLKIIDSLKNESPFPIKGIGIASAGPLDHKNRKYLYPVHLPHLRNFNLGDFLEKNTGLKTVMENDAQAAALGEVWQGCLKGSKDAIYITLGTGVGSGIIKNRKIWRASHITGPELGHLYMGLGNEKECGCGQIGCAETYLGKSSFLELFWQEKIEVSSPEEAYMMIKMGKIDVNKKNKIFKKYGKRLGLFLSMLIVIFGIKDIGIGGGLSKFVPLCIDYVWETIRKRFKKREWWLPKRIEVSLNPNLSALFGMVKILKKETS